MTYTDGKYTVKKTANSDVNHVSQHMRPVDVMEVHLSYGLSPYYALRTSVIQSDEAYTISFDGIPFAIFGLAKNNTIKNVAAIWMLSTSDLDNHKKMFHAITKKYLAYFHKKAFLLFNFVSGSNSISLHWLRKLGATFSYAKPYGKFGTMFKYFELRGA